MLSKLQELELLPRDWVALRLEVRKEAVAVVDARRLHDALHDHLVDAALEPGALVVNVLTGRVWGLVQKVREIQN